MANSINKSGTIIAAATAQMILPANARRKGFRFQCIGINLVLNDIGIPPVAFESSSGNIGVSAGLVYQSPPDWCSTGAVYLYAAADENPAGVKFSLIEYE